VAGVGLKLKKTVVLVGMMGAGKTAVGTQLSRRLHVPFMDSDAEIERAANREIAEIFARDGEDFFRDRESKVIARLLRGRPGILSTGGGAFMMARNRETISAIGVSVWLKADLETLWFRVRQKDTRPLLKTPDPKATLTRLFEERTPIYAKADLVVDVVRERSIEETADQVIAVLAAAKGILEKV
jgi:shikimate kinase